MSRSRFAILGLGQFGTSLATELAKLGCDVLAVDVSTRRVDPLRDKVTVAAVAAARDRAALEELLATPFDGAVVSIGDNLEASIMATLHLKELGVEKVWAEATTPERGVVLQRVGAARVISPENDMGRRLAQRMANPNLVEFLPLTKGFGVVELEAPSWTHGKTLAELDLRREMNLAVIALQDADGNATVVPGPDSRLDHKVVVTVVGRDADLTRFRERK